MKKNLLKIIAGLLLIFSPLVAGAVVFTQSQLIIPPFTGMVMSTTTANGRFLQASTSPTLNSITATSTTLWSLFPNISFRYSSSTIYSSFLNSSTTFGTFGTLTIPNLGTPAGKFLAVDPNGKVIATTTPSGGSATPGGSDTQVQFNDSGSFGGSSKFLFDKISGDVTLDGGELIFKDDAIPTDRAIEVADQSAIDTVGNKLYIQSGSGNGTGANGNLYMFTPDRTITNPSDLLANSVAEIQGHGLNDNGTLTVTNSGQNDTALSGMGSYFSASSGGNSLTGGNIDLLSGNINVNTIADYSSGLTGGEVFLSGGTVSASENQVDGGNIEITGGEYDGAVWLPGSISLTAGSSQSGNVDGGNIVLTAGSESGSGSTGSVAMISSDSSSLIGVNKTVGVSLRSIGGSTIHFDTTSSGGGDIVVFPALGGTDTICFQTLANCSTGGSSFGFPFTVNTGYNSTSTVIGFNGLFSTASSTFSGPLRLPSLSQGFAGVGSNGTVYTFATSSISLSQLTNDLANLTATNGTLTLSGNYNGSVARTVGLNLGNANTWIVNQTFNYSSSTAYSSFQTASTTNLIVNGDNFNDLTGTGLSISGGALTNTGIVTANCSGGTTCSGTNPLSISSFVFPFTSSATGNFNQIANATGTQIHLSGNPIALSASSTSVFDNASSTFGTIGTLWLPNLTSGVLNVDSVGKVYKQSTSTLTGTGLISVTAGAYTLGGTPIVVSCATCGAGTVTVVTGTWPIISSGGATPNLTWGGLATSSGLTSGRVHYSTGVNTFADVATSSIASGVGITVTNGSTAYVLGAQPSFACNTASASVFGCINASDFSKFNSATTTFSTGLTYTQATNAVTVNTSQNISTLSNLTSNGFVTTSGSTGALSVSTFPITYAQGGTGTTTAPVGQLLYGGSTAYQSVATTTATCTGSTSCTTFTVIGASPVTITSSGSSFTGSANSIVTTDPSGALQSTSSQLTVGTILATTTGPTNATSTFMGQVLVGKGMPYGYLGVGSTTPAYGYLTNTLSDSGGNLNDFLSTNTYNNSASGCATADQTVNNDIATVTFNFGDFGHTSSGFTGIGCTNNPFTGYRPNSTYLYDPNGDMYFSLGSTTRANFQWLGGGYTEANKLMTLNVNGRLGLGTTSPWALLSLNAPAQTNPYFAIGSTTLTVFSISPSTGSTGTLTLSTTTAGCAQFSSVGLIYSTGVACGSGSGGAFPFTSSATSFFNQVANATGTQLHLSGSPISLSASSTSQFDNSTTTFATISTLWLGSSQGLPFVGSGNKVGIVGTTTCPTFSTGLTYSGTAASCIGGTNGNVTVNTSQNIATLSNLSTNGYMYTSGAAGTLNTAASSTETCSAPVTCTNFDVLKGGAAISLGTVTVALGGTNATSFGKNSIITSSADGLSLTATGTQLTVGNLLATTTATSYFSGNLGIRDTSADYTFETATSQSNGYFGVTQTNDGDLFNVSANGGTGIGTTTPTFLSQSTIASSTASQLALSAGSGIAMWTMRNAGGKLYFSTTTTTGTATTSIAAMTLSDTGKPGLSISSSTPNAQLVVNAVNTTDFSNLFLISSTTGAVQSVSTSTIFRIDNNGQVYFGNYADCSGTNALQISTKKLVCASVVSDGRLKKDIEPITNGLQMVLNLKPVTFNWKDLTNFNTSDPREQMGFIAQDVEPLIPSAIGMSTDGYKTLDKTKIIPYIVDAIKSLWQNVTDLIAWNKDQDKSLKKLEDQNALQQKEIDELKAEIKNLK